jgi:hypothetical protein
MTLELMGDSSAFDGPTLSASPSFWNSFILERSFSLTISNQSGDGGLILGTVGNFTATPEPGTFFSACEAFFAIGVFCRARRPIFSD